MEKKSTKKPAPKKKAAAPKKKVVIKKVEAPILAPEATPFVADYHKETAEVKVPSFWGKVKNFLGF